MSALVTFGLPNSDIWRWTHENLARVPQSPFLNKWLTYVFDQSMKVSTPLTIAIVYFSLVHFVNPIVRNRQVKQTHGSKKTYDSLSKDERRRLKAAPYWIATRPEFKVFVLLHNVFLCAYSVWTFFGMVSTIQHTIASLKPVTQSSNSVHNFFQSVCDLNNGIFKTDLPVTNLTVFGWWFYMSKFYEVLDTVVILLKGRPLSLLQSYHHSGAMMCMWGGIRYQLPPIWIFVVFNSFIHSLMYFYFSLSCLKIRVPNVFKRVLTSMQILQFVLGGSLAVLHAFIYYTDLATSSMKSCIGTADQALPLFINVTYLTPLTGLFAAFYIESYIKRARH